MNAKLKPHSVRQREVKRTGRICGHGICRAEAIFTIEQTFTRYFGNSYTIKRHRCAVHAAPCVEAKVAV